MNMNEQQQERLAAMQAADAAREEAHAARVAEQQRNQMTPWLDAEYKADLEKLVAQQLEENPHQTTREMLMLRKIQNDGEALAPSETVHVNADGQQVMTRMEELDYKFKRHQSTAEEDADYSMPPEELSELQIMLMQQQEAAPKPLDSMTKAELTDAAQVAAENGDMSEYRRLRLAARGR